MPHYIFELCLILLAVALFLQKSRNLQHRSNAGFNCITESVSGRRFLIFSFMFLGFLVMFRGEYIGNDTVEYIRVFDRYRVWNFDNRFEPGYNVLMSVTKLIIENKYAIIVVSGAITTFLFYDFIKRYSKYYFLSVIFFVFLEFWGQSLNLLRQTLACAVIVFSYRYLLRKDFLKFVITVLIATSFHISAILFLAAWFIRYIKLNGRIVFFFLVGVTAVYTSFFTLLKFSFMIDDSFESYTDSIYGEGNRIGALFQASCYIGLVAFAWIIRMHVGARSFRANGLDTPFLLCFCGAVILLLSFNMSIFGRIAQHFNVFSLILIPNAVRLLSSRGQSVVTFLLFIYVNIYFWVIQIYRPEWNVIFPYQTSFQ